MELLEETIKAIDVFLRLAQKEQPFVDPNLNPVLLVPGIAGSILHAVDENGGAEERVWVRIIGADYEFRSKLWSRFDPATGQSVSLDEKVKIVVPEDRYGLYAIDCLDPSMIVGSEGLCYYHDMIEEMKRWGYQEGKTLFGFGYDFRQSNRLKETMDRFSAKLESMYTLSGGKKVSIITHSMGGLLVKCFMCLYTNVFEKFVNSWIAIAAPFQGAPGYVNTSLLNGMSFVEGWEANFFITRWSMQKLLIECPSIYELMGCPHFSWKDVPILQLWKEQIDESGKPSPLLESYGQNETISLMTEALSKNSIHFGEMEIPLPFNNDIFKWSNETRDILSQAKVPETVKFYNIYGTNISTPHSVCYGSQEALISDLGKLLISQPQYTCVDGDGTVPAESAKADGLDAVARVAVAADHRGIVCNKYVFRILQHWLKAGEPDPYYNPLNDYVILPTNFEIQRLADKTFEITNLKEEWDIISSSNLDQELPPMVSSLSVSRGDNDQKSVEGAQATLIVHPQSNGIQHVEVRAQSVTSCSESTQSSYLL